jgi:FixJ family two-component response regulator
VARPVISIVDDDESVREGTVDLFNSMGFAAVAFLSAGDFLSSDHLHGTSCLVADVQIPGMTGLELHNRLLGSGIMIPTILITGFPNDRDRTRALQTGVICYLAKPFNHNDLLTCIRAALEADETDEPSGRES